MSGKKRITDKMLCPMDKDIADCFKVGCYHAQPHKKNDTCGKRYHNVCNCKGCVPIKHQGAKP